MTTTRPQPSVARQSTLRSTNLALVLRTVCAADTPPSRADVATRAGTTRATATRLVDDLVAGGLLDEGARPTPSGPGRPATPLLPSARTGALGLQVDAGLLAARVLDLRGRVVAEHVEERDLAGADPEPTLARLGALATEVVSGAGGVRLAGAGLALPGLVDAGSGVLLQAPNLGWSGVPAADLLATHLPGGLTPLPGNEADLAARTVAEAAPGRPGPLRDFLYLSGQIGIGGAAVLDGHVVGGSAGWAGEVGHVCVDPAGPACRCGSTGCLEQYAGRHALMVAAGLARDAPPAELAARVAAGDADAERAVTAAADALGVALAGVLNVLDLPTVVLGGQLGALTGLLRPRVEHLLGRRVLSARWRRMDVREASALPAAGATGAALRALDGVLADPARWID
ncbi:ROK family protein [Geodermatophilus sp. URMC 62]|uniref:ROK family protein n=1 Tax=Geodermatophilus sp. URMC 62 TaxID=3423414 RepID=UPI00406CA758